MSEVVQPDADTSTGTATVLPRVSILVTSQDDETVIERSLRSLLALDYPAYEILLVDRGSVDATPGIAESLVAASGRRLRVFRRARVERSEASNLALRVSRQPLVLSVDVGSTLVADGLMAAVRGLHDPRVAAVIGITRLHPDEPRGEWRGRRPDERLGERRDDPVVRLRRAELASHRVMHTTRGGAVRVRPWPGHAALFRRTALIDAGAYRPDDDDDRCRQDMALMGRLLGSGYEVRVEPALVAFVNPPVSLPMLMRERAARRRAWGRRRRSHAGASASAAASAGAAVGAGSGEVFEEQEGKGMFLERYRPPEHRRDIAACVGASIDRAR